jgi:tRNA (guanine-N7-)-methyltransferase
VAKKRIIGEYPEISIGQETLDGHVDFEDIFGRKAPIHIEVGSGKGTFLVSETRAHPENNYLGIEWANRYYRLAVDRIGRWGIDNVRIMRTDAAVFFAENVPDDSVSWFHIYFPDPWPKVRHNKRRLICTDNVQQIIRCLEPGGVLNLATDHADYFEQMEEVLNAEFANGTLDQIPFTRAAGAKEGETVGTNFERKYIVEGRKINTIAAKKPETQG